MRVIYIAKHGSGGNDDEEAIAFALTKLGHEVVPIQEAQFIDGSKLVGDLALFHHPHNLAAVASVCIPKVFWCFDLVAWDASVRHQNRMTWARQMLAVADLGFFTDGDWVTQDATSKAIWLTQGADERETAQWSIPANTETDVLFVGGVGYGRDEFVTEMRIKYGRQFKHISKGCYGSALEYEIRSAKIVLAPDTPVSARYWSNRVYNVLRLGGFLLHPYCAGLRRQYPNLFTYRNRDGLHGLIRDFLHSDRGWSYSLAWQAHTLENHTYRHRCVELLRTVKERLDVG